MSLLKSRLVDKLWAGILVVLVVLLLVGSAGVQRRAQEAMLGATQVAQDHEALAVQAQRARAGADEVLRQVLGQGLPRDPLAARAYAARVREVLVDPAHLQRGVERVERSRVQDLSLARVSEARAAVQAALRRLDDLTIVGDPVTRGGIARAELPPALHDYTAALDRFITLQVQRRDAARETARRSRSATFWIAASALAFVATLGAAALLLAVSRRQRPVPAAAPAGTGASFLAPSDIDEQSSDPDLGWAMDATAAWPAPRPPSVGRVDPA